MIPIASVLLDPAPVRIRLVASVDILGRVDEASSDLSVADEARSGHDTVIEEISLLADVEDVAVVGCERRRWDEARGTERSEGTRSVDGRSERDAKERQMVPRYRELVQG